MIGLRLASVLLLAFITLGLSGCSSSKPTIQPKSINNEQPEAMEPMEDTQDADLATEDQPVEASPNVVPAPNYPDRYVVVKGDTLWDISKRFLRDPWLWPSVWHVNPDIRNPHLIYPGDVIVMHIVDGRVTKITTAKYPNVRPPKITPPTGQKKQKPLVRIKSGLKMVRLSPSSRISGINKAISTIPMNAIRPFLDRPRVVTEDELDDAPYIVSSYEEHLISSKGNRIYALNLEEPRSSYNIVRPGKEYVDPESGDVLGFEAIYLADASLIKEGEYSGEPATLAITNSLREVLNNDVLIPHEEHEEMFQFTPRSPKKEVKGQIMSVFNGVSQIGQYMVVVLNRGKEDGLEPGHVLAVLQKGATVYDSNALIFSQVDLPDERAGIMMVFKTYENLSYALIMEASRAMHVNDRFENP